MSKVHRGQERLRRWSWALIDAAVWVIAMVLATWLRYDFEAHRIEVHALTVLSAVAVVGQMVIGGFIGPYAVGHLRGSFEEAIDVIRVVCVVFAALIVAVFVFEVGPIPRSVPFTATTLAVLGMCAARFLIRTWRTQRAARTSQNTRAIIFGAGEAGRRLTRSLIRDTDSGFRPVALLDDDPAKSRLRLEGVRVRGGRDMMAKAAEKYDAGVLILAMPLVEAATLRQLTEMAQEAGLRVLTLPPIRDIIDGRPTAGDLRNVDVADLLGRRPVQLDMAAIADQIAGRRVLVTGAGGSIGSELCRQIARFCPDKLFMLDRDESGLQATQLSLHGNGLLDSDELILACLRDAETIERTFAQARPDIVFHAAALKHLPLLEAYPDEAFQSNVIGTLNVLRAAAAVGVGTFVNISTDKAANPTCVLGYSKRLAERLTADFAHRFPGRYVSVRFGNVLGSRGSVVHAFTAQIESGGPITVTHPDVERYFMLIPEACQLVLQSASIGSDGEVMVLDMGEQVKILDVARTLIRMSGRRDIDIAFTGLRPGEKLGEELFSGQEQPQPTSHPLVSRVGVPAISAAAVAAQVHDSPEATRAWMRAETIVDLLETNADPRRVAHSRVPQISHPRLGTTPS